MKIILLFLFFILFFLSCSKEVTVTLPNTLQTKVKPSSFYDLPNFEQENFAYVLDVFLKNCQTTKGKILYGKLCMQAKNVTDAKSFIEENFTPYRIEGQDGNDKGLLTGYYEAEIHVSHHKSQRYKYPLYATPKDLITVQLASIYPELKNYRLRGRLEGNRLVPYYTRKESSSKDINATVLCYCDSLIDKFFLEIQGSGIATFEDNSSIYLGYDNQNGHKYRSIGKYLIDHNEISKDKVSLQSIKKWLLEHPKRVDEVLNYNNSMVFFSKRKQRATGALGIELTPMHSIAVDKRYIPLGNMLYLYADLNNTKINKIVFAQDTGGAIKGSLRADLFVGSGKDALELAGHLKAPMKLWVLLPKKTKLSSHE